MKNSGSGKNKTVTIRDVAKQANVTIGTVSRFLNGYRLRPENARRVENAIKATGYQTNLFARGLRNNSSMTVGVVIQNFQDIFASTMAGIIENELNEAGYSIVLCDFKNDTATMEQRLGFLLDRSVDGVILFGKSDYVGVFDRYSDANIPVVLAGEEILEYQTDKIQLDHYTAGMLAANQLLQAGHTEIGVVNGPQKSYTARERYRGFSEALQRHGLEPQNDLIRWSDFTTRGGYEAMKSFLESGTVPSSVFATNYYMTIGALMAINETPIRVGQELSVVGFDRLDPIFLFKPELTVIQQPIGQMAREAAHLLLRRMRNDFSDYPKKQVFAPTVHHGRSVRDVSEGV